MKEKTNFNSFDLAKFILSIMVIAIHAKPFKDISEVIHTFISGGICRIAVPLFFVIAGYLFAYGISKTDDKKKYIKKYLVKLFKFYVIWTIIYLPFIIKTLINNNHSFIVDIIIFIRNFVFVGSYMHLWYIKDLIISIFIIMILKKFKFSNKKVLIISLVLYVIGMCIDSYYFSFLNIVGENSLIATITKIYLKLFKTTRNALFFGMIFVFLGIYRYQKGTTRVCSNHKSKIFALLMAFGLEIAILYYNGGMRDCNMYLLLLPLTYMIFDLLLNIQLTSNKLNFKLLRNLSTLIYFTHVIFLKICQRFISNNLIIFIVVTLCSIAFSYLIIILSKKIKILKKLYN